MKTSPQGRFHLARSCGATIHLAPPHKPVSLLHLRVVSHGHLLLASTLPLVWTPSHRPFSERAYPIPFILQAQMLFWWTCVVSNPRISACFRVIPCMQLHPFLRNFGNGHASDLCRQVIMDNIQYTDWNTFSTLVRRFFYEFSFEKTRSCSSATFIGLIQVGFQ